jgi:hypothetical protein
MAKAPSFFASAKGVYRSPGTDTASASLRIFFIVSLLPVSFVRYYP